MIPGMEERERGRESIAKQKQLQLSAKGAKLSKTDLKF